jgi:penicillin-binding protein 1B
VDLREGRKQQGASTLSQQLARSLWLDLEKRWSRKLAEMMITLQLEQRLSKEQIFEYYCNEVYLGHRGTFAIHGFGEAARVYFGKDISQLDLAEAAALAGLIQRPMSLNPFRYPERMRDRRNVILSLIRQNGHISDREYALAVESPLTLAKPGNQSLDAPYFVDMVNDALQTQFQDVDFQSSSYRIYTTLDLDLQRAATESVRTGMELVDEQLRKQRRFRDGYVPQAQVALVALDPHTGEIKALVGGRNYGLSQLNRAIAKRQPGSIFKPFVYAAAMDTALEGGSRVLTPASSILDEPTTFWFDNRPYEPSNHKREYHGQVTIRRALAGSLNVAAVKVAEMVGYDTVADLARRAGMNYDIHATPSIALGAYEVTPVEIAGAYTIFANGGELAKPNFISMVRSDGGRIVFKQKPERSRVLDPRVSYLVVNLMEEVMRSGTGGGARSLGFRVPAGGKTGTSRDGWFAGFTSELLCVVWVGFDDGRELYLEGARSALPIWTELMKRALKLRNYRNARPFQSPDGIITVDVDPASGMLAAPGCPQRRAEVFVAGTQPASTCPLHGGGGDGTMVAGWDMPASSSPPAIAPVKAIPRRAAAEANGAASHPVPNSGAVAVKAENPPEPEKKKGLFRRFLGVFK